MIGLLKKNEIGKRQVIGLTVNSKDKVKRLVHSILELKVKGVVKTIGFKRNEAQKYALYLKDIKAKGNIRRNIIMSSGNAAKLRYPGKRHYILTTFTLPIIHLVFFRCRSFNAGTDFE